MRFNSSPARMMMRVGCAILFWLVSASLAQAASSTQGQRATGALCDAHSTTLRKLIRHSKSFGGPLARRPQRALFGLADITARLQRGARAGMTDGDDAAIQNDAPAANVDADSRTAPTLQPLEGLVGSLDRRPRTRAFSPKSPRGPPVAA
jgi:hypothetical protein